MTFRLIFPVMAIGALLLFMNPLAAAAYFAAVAVILYYVARRLQSG